VFKKRLRKMIHSASFFCLCLLLSTGVFGDTDEVKSVSVTEGDSVTLNTDVKVQRDDHILWTFGPQESRIAEIYRQNINIDATNTIFEKRLQMDSFTGSLTIRNIRSTDSGLYKLQIIISRKTSYKRFNVSVYARLPVPVITRNSSNCSSTSPTSVSRCSLLCSAVNVRDVTLSWYKGNSLLSSISVSDLSISLSLPLELECLDDSYSCVVAYSFTNRTTHLNNTDLCQPCPGITFSLFLLLFIKCVIIIKTVKAQEEEILYADTTFCAYRVKSMVRYIVFLCELCLLCVCKHLQLL
uniref:Ig-like domain-containing protein n=1 Tax=Cyprinus carpio TaxID=7962 RepID=A0A8C1SNT3_CYPCA